MLASAGLGYRAQAVELSLAAARQDGAAIDLAAEESLSALHDLRGSMTAYLAPNQGSEFWSKRVGTTLDALKQRLVSLDSAMAATGGSLADSLDSVDQLAAADRRALQYVDRGELILAGDVLFTEVRDLLAAVNEQVAGGRQVLRHAADRRVAGIRQEQLILAAAGIGVWFLAALLLLPRASAPAKEPGEWRQELADTINKPEPADNITIDLKRPDLVEPPQPLSAVTLPTVDLTLVAEICSDLSALTDAGALSGALARACTAIGAKGLIVWVATNDGGSLSPVSTHGFDERIVKRIGAIARADANMTAEALRENAPRVSPATATAGAALAVPMCGPTGPVGVLSAELQPGKLADEACLAVASILAAQLATLTAPVPAAAVERSAESAVS